MTPVQLFLHEGVLLLRARNSEIVVLSEHVKELQSKNKIAEFTNYFLNSALVNRPARKLFQAWLQANMGRFNISRALLFELLQK